MYRKIVNDLRERHNRKVKVMGQFQGEEKPTALDCLRKLNPEDGHTRMNVLLKATATAGVRLNARSSNARTGDAPLR